MTGERLMLAIPDDQVCVVCQAVVLDMTAHQQWHDRLAEHIAQRVAGVERRVRAITRQAADLIAIQRGEGMGSEV